MAGVFCVHLVRAGKPLVAGVANVGCRPTMDGTKNVLEVHLFDFAESIYGEKVQVFFLHKLREERTFASVDTLIAAIEQDVVAAKAYFQEPSGVIPTPLTHFL